MPDTTSASNLTAIIKSARDVMRKDAGLNGDADRTPQFAWLLFLKAFDELEESLEVTDPDYEAAIEPPYRWRDWAASSTKRRSGDGLLSFVNDRLLPYLSQLSGSGTPGDAREILSQVFQDTRNRMVSGYLLADLVDAVNRVSFQSADDIHTMAYFYETMLKEMRDAAGDAGEFYTPRPVIRFMVKVTDPHPGEVVMDPAAGTGGFLVEAWEHAKSLADKSSMPAHNRARLRGMLRGFEKKPMPFLLSQMNLLLHGADYPKVTRGNALTFSAADQRRDGVDVVLTNPPFGGEEEDGVKEYFPSDFRTAETSWLFLQSVMERITRAKNGRAAVVVPNGVLFDSGVGGKIKKRLLSEFNLHTVVRLPNGVFSPYTLIPTNILFFEAGGPTSDLWFYELPLPSGRKNYTKTKPLRHEEFEECEAWWGGRERAGRTASGCAWQTSAAEVAADGYNLDLRNPDRGASLEESSPSQLVHELIDIEHAVFQVLGRLQLISKEVERHEV